MHWMHVPEIFPVLAEMDIADAKNDSALGVLQILTTRKDKLITALPMLSTKLK